ncbi:hypothetical protein RLJV_24115 [Pseudomonas aeruginosa]|nr:hypothetical protein RLJV_24115 [Pseudomonas aeruginosa]
MSRPAWTFRLFAASTRAALSAKLRSQVRPSSALSAAVVEVVGRRREVVPRAQGADVMQVAAAHQLHVATLDQRTVGCQPTPCK